MPHKKWSVEIVTEQAQRLKCCKHKLQLIKLDCINSFCIKFDKLNLRQHKKVEEEP